MVISLVSFGLFGPALSTTNINIVKWRYFVIFSPVFFCSLNWEFSYSNWEKNILFGIGNTTEYRSSKRAKKNPDKDDVKFPNFSQNAAYFPDSMGPGPIPKKGCESPVAAKTISGKKSGPA